MLTTLLRLADAAYRAGTPLLPDAVFDHLSRLAPNALPPLTSTLLSLDCPADPLDWLEANPGPYAVSLKADGCTVALHYLDGVLTHAHLRGGRDVTRAALAAGALRDLPGAPSGHIEVHCEAIAPNVSRNACVAALRRGHANFRILLLAFDLIGIPALRTQAQTLEWLQCAGFGTLAVTLANTPDEVLDLFAAFADQQHCFPFACDGLVVKLNDRAIQRSLGANSRAPRYAISLKP